jgi:hypothetical protein
MGLTGADDGTETAASDGTDKEGVAAASYNERKKRCIFKEKEQ